MWKIYYADGDSQTYEYPENILDRIRVQAIAQENEKGWHVVSHADYYVFDKEMGFYGVDYTGLLLYWMKAGREKVVLFGETMHTPIFQEIHQKALAFADAKRRETI